MFVSIAIKSANTGLYVEQNALEVSVLNWIPRRDIPFSQNVFKISNTTFAHYKISYKQRQ